MKTTLKASLVRQHASTLILTGFGKSHIKRCCSWWLATGHPQSGQTSNNKSNSSTGIRPTEGCPIAFQVFCLPIPIAFYGLCTGWIHERNPKHLAKVPSGVPAYKMPKYHQTCISGCGSMLCTMFTMDRPNFSAAALSVAIKIENLKWLSPTIYIKVNNSSSPQSFWSNASSFFSPSCSFGTGANSSHFTARTDAHAPFIFRGLNTNSIPSRKVSPAPFTHQYLTLSPSTWVPLTSRPRRLCSCGITGCRTNSFPAIIASDI